MSTSRYKTRDAQAIHFTTFVSAEWMKVFTRKNYRDRLIDSPGIAYSINLVVHRSCIIGNHVYVMGEL